jgi:bifunctional non-homologous end joining protein LigD
MPVAWAEFSKLKSGAQWTIANAREQLSFQTSDSGEGYWKSKQTLKDAMNKPSFKPKL